MDNWYALIQGNVIVSVEQFHHEPTIWDFKKCPIIVSDCKVAKVQVIITEIMKPLQ